MKRVFSLIGAALIAGSMLFTSCGGEKFTITAEANDATMGTVTGGGEYEPNATVVLTAVANEGFEFVKWNDGNTENPRTITVTENASYVAEFAAVATVGTTKITLNGNSWNAANQLGYDYTSDGYITFVIFKTANSADDVYLQGFLESTPCQGATYESTGGDYFKYYDANNTWVDEDGALGQGAGVEFYRYNAVAESFVENINAVDLNALTINATWSEDIFDIANYAAAGGADYGQTWPLTGEMNNSAWTWATSKSAATAKTNKGTVINKVK